MQISSSFVSCVNHNKCEHRCVSGVSWYGMVSKDRITDEGANKFAKITGGAYWRPGGNLYK